MDCVRHDNCIKFTECGLRIEEALVMARVTVEDCEKIVPNRFDLVVLAAQRTRQILAGNKVEVEDKDEKKPVIALREIAAEAVSVNGLKDDVVKTFRTFSPEEDLQEDIEDISEEEDTYNPYINVDLKALELDGSTSVVNEADFEDEDGECDEQDSKTVE